MLTQSELAWITEELAEHLTGGAVQKVYAEGSDAYVLRVRVPGATHLLRVALDPELGRAHFTRERGPQPPSPTAFTMLLRKRLGGMVVREVSASPNDRVLTLRGDTRDPEGDGRSPVTLVVELTGAITNAFVLGAEDVVLGAHSTTRAAERGLSPGDTYAPPTPPPASPDGAQDHNRFDDAPGDPSTEDDPLHATPRSARVEDAYAARDAELTLDRARADLLSDLKRASRRLRRHVRNIEGDLERAHQAQDLRRWGELLQSAYGKIPRGADSASVPDYYAEGMPTVEIPLDPARSLQENIDSYFAQYRRLHGAIDRIESRLLEAMESLEAVDAARDDARRATSLDALERARGAVAQTLRPRQRQRPPSARGDAERAPYRTFVATSGAEILVGRGARHNDALTTKHARGRDLWLHARDWAGAHVVLRLNRGEEPRHQDLLDAATLAAHFSKGKEDTLVDVTHTKAKNVRKPKGYPPGRVTVSGGKTLAIAIEPGRLERLFAHERRGEA
jgi:predicted ribosome quality control (RQC) complex YloA/Tae2 family protein